MAYSYGNDYELESKIKEMSIYLDRLVLGEERDYRFDSDCVSCTGVGPYGKGDFSRRTPPLSYIPSLPPSTNPMNISTQNSGIPITPAQYTLTRVTSALANRMNTYNSTLRFINSAPYHRARKWANNKQIEKGPNTSGIDIERTMVELGLTPESLKSNEVYILFSAYNKLAVYIHAEYIFETIYEGCTLPNTMSASAQTRHAVWSSNKLLRQSRDVLRKYSHVPSEYQKPYGECKQSLEELHVAILKLETFKFCSLEHRRGKFVSEEARGNFEPLLKSLNQVIRCVGKCRTYIQVIDWALHKVERQVEAATTSSSKGPSQPLPQADSAEPSGPKGRPSGARRYIG